MSPNQFETESDRIYARLEKTRRPDLLVISQKNLGRLHDDVQKVVMVAAVLSVEGFLREGVLPLVSVDTDQIGPMLGSLVASVVGGIALSRAFFRHVSLKQALPVGSVIDDERQTKVAAWVQNHPRLGKIVQRWEAKNLLGKLSEQQFEALRQGVSDLEKANKRRPRSKLGS